jgi:hypothetical protein
MKKILALFAFLFIASSAQAATLLSTTTGNFTAAGTWKVASAVASSEIDSDASSFNLSTGNSDSTAFTPAATGIDAVAIKISSIVTPTGTVTVKLRNSTTSTDAATVTINASDLATSAKGWHVFSFATVTPNGTDSYIVRLTRSVADAAANRISIQASTAAAANMCREIRLVTTQAPVANDKLIVAGEFTGAGASTSYTVTMDETATTSYGPIVSGGPPQGLTVNNKATFAYGVAASTNYYLKLKGILHVYSGGTFTIGTSGSPMPSTSTAVLEFASVANVDSGLYLDNGSVFNTYGNALTYDRAVLAADEGGLCNTSGTTVTRIEGDGFTGMSGNIIINGTTYTISSVTNNNTLVLTSTAGTQTFSTYVLAATTSLTTDVSTGWLNGDSIQIATTNRFFSAKLAENERVSLTANAVGTGLTTSALVYGHMGTSPTQAEVANLTRNVKIRGMSQSLSGFVYIGATATVSSYWTEYYYLGSATAGKRSIEVATTTGTVDFQRCSFYDANTGTNMGNGFWFISQPSGGITISNNIFANMTYIALYTYVSHTGTNTYSGNLFIKTYYGIESYDNSDTITNNTFVGCTARGIYLGEEGSLLGTISGNTIHSSSYGLLSGGSIVGGTISNTTAWRNTYGISMQDDGSNWTIDTATLFGNDSAQIYMFASHLGCIIKNVTANAGTGIVGQYGFFNSGDIGDLLVANSSFGVTTQFSLANFTGTGNTLSKTVFHNVTWGAGTMVAANSLNFESSVSFEKYNGTAGDHRTYTGYGVEQTDSTIFKTATPSSRLTHSGTNFLFKSGIKRVAIVNNSTVSIACWVRESVVGDGTDYNGERIKLWVKANPSIGINSDTLLATATVASEGAWEQLTGTTPTATDDGVVEFYTTSGNSSTTPTGWVNVDDFSITG